MAERGDRSPKGGDLLSNFSARQRVLAAALKLFVEKGYFNTNVPDLSRESKCSVGSIYHNFKNKEEVARELYAESLKAFRSTLANSLRGATDPKDVVTITVRSFLTFSELNHQLSRYIWLCRHTEFLSGVVQHPTRVGFDPLGRILTRALKKGMKEGKIRKLRANLIWNVLFGIPQSYVRDWLDKYNPEPPTKVADELAEMCWKALKAD
jgi:TetR/AcrR family transcriptional regulator, repressor of fatR-cypB operon